MTTATYEDLRRAIEGERLPALLIDLDAFDRNVDRVVGRMSKINPRLKLRIATKSVRIPALLRRAYERGGDRMVDRGVMCFSLQEAALLSKEGFHDLFVAYPTSQSADLDVAALLTVSGIDVSVAIDCEEHAERISNATKDFATTRSMGRVRVVICADMSIRLGGMHVGVRRSPIATPKDAVALARFASRLPGTVVHGLMGYEAQIAGLADDRPDDSSRWAKRIVRRASVPIVRRRRRAMVDALRKDGHSLAMINGGGTGSLDSTARDDVLTEITCGSAFFKPLAFDHFTDAHVRELEPSCFFALEVCRIPAPGFVTCLGGGYVASGPPGPWSAPQPWLPSNVELLPAEMAGEVQTPLRVRDRDDRRGGRYGGERHHSLKIGDPVFFRHAKAGEVAERFTEALFIRNGRIVERAQTYRGMGVCFF